MFCSKRVLAMLLLSAACTKLAVSATLGQSLAITQDSKTNVTVTASTAQGDPHTLQASSNLHLWADIHDPVQGEYTYQFDGTTVPRRYFRLPPSPPPAAPIRVMLIGDSMTSDCCGWGGGIYGYFKPNATVINYA